VLAVLVNFNRRDLVLDAVHSLRQCDYPADRLEIIVVDNGSTDGSRQALAQQPGVRLILLDGNPGPAAARNAGIARARGEFLLLLDSDARLAPHGLRRTIELLAADPSITIAALRILNGHTGEVDHWIYAQPHASHGRRSFDTYSFSAAGAVIRACAARAVGGFWEPLFVYNEEVEFSIRVIGGGGRVVYLPSATVLHYPSPRGRDSFGAYFRYQVRNWIWIFRRHYPARQRWSMIALYCGIYAVKGLANGTLRQCVRGMIDGLAGCPASAQSGTRLTGEQTRHLRTLNRRWIIRLRDIAATRGPRALVGGQAAASALDIAEADAVALR